MNNNTFIIELIGLFLPLFWIFIAGLICWFIVDTVDEIKAIENNTEIEEEE